MNSIFSFDVSLLSPPNYFCFPKENCPRSLLVTTFLIAMKFLVRGARGAPRTLKNLMAIKNVVTKRDLGLYSLGKQKLCGGDF